MKEVASLRAQLAAEKARANDAEENCDRCNARLDPLTEANGKLARDLRAEKTAHAETWRLVRTLIESLPWGPGVVGPIGDALRALLARMPK